MEDADEDQSEDADEDEDEDEARVLIVKTQRFATPESLARSALRDAESRRPRELHETRLLLRQGGPIRACGQAEAAAARVEAGRRLRAQRSTIERCLVDAIARRPEIIVKAPSAMVLEQARRRRDPGVRFVLRFGPDSDAPQVHDPDAQLDAQTRACVERSFQGAGDERLSTIVEVPIVAFTQLEEGFSASPLHRELAGQALLLGWLHYERSEYEDALAYFSDAYWIYHLVEYQVLIGMAYEALGDRDAAANAYGRYLEERPRGLDAAGLAAWKR